RLVRAGWRSGNGGGIAQAGSPAPVHRGCVCDRGAFGHSSGRQLQTARQTDFQDGPPAPSLRAARLGRIESNRAILDRGADHGSVRADYVETAMKLDGARVAVVGMARSGVAAAELLAEKGARVIRVDQKPASDDVLPQTEESFGDTDLIVLSPGVPADIE